jgi:methylthioribose-1-phosphate isomerase
MHIKTIEWKNNSVKIIDQTRLPLKLQYLYIKDLKTLWKAIRNLEVRGAPALGAAAGLGVYIGMRGSKARDFSRFYKELNRVIAYLSTARPTAINLFWGLERMRTLVLSNKDKPIPSIKKMLLSEAQKIIEEDRKACRRIGYFGAKIIRDNHTVLTVCNAGILATIDYGTALGIIYRAKQDGKRIKVFACETRPLLQGARLTTWELNRGGIEVTLICDNMAATLMRQGKIDEVITGADRIASNGDAANKIGTYNLAVLAHYHNIPFYIAAPASTFDLSIGSARAIPIEERPAGEVTGLFFKQPIAAKGIKVYNPAFDATPSDLITAIITDRGIIRPPFKKNIAKLLGKIKC